LEEDLEVSADEDVDWRGLVWLTLEELQRFYLIQKYLSQPISPVVQSAGESRVSRRKMIKTATLVGGFAVGSMFPLVKSIVAPAPGMAAPPSPTPSSTPIPIPTPTPTPSPWKIDAGPTNNNGNFYLELSRTFPDTRIGDILFDLKISTEGNSVVGVDLTKGLVELSTAIGTDGNYEFNIDGTLPDTYNVGLGGGFVVEEPRFELKVSGNINDMEDSNIQGTIKVPITMDLPLTDLFGNQATLSGEFQLSSDLQGTFQLGLGFTLTF
jgi:hypothetical protein